MTIIDDIDNILGDHETDRLTTMLTLVFGGYEHEEPLTDTWLNILTEDDDEYDELEHGPIPGGREGFQRGVHYPGLCYPDGEMSRCGDIAPKISITELSTPYEMPIAVRAYMEGLTGKPRSRLWHEGPDFRQLNHSVREHYKWDQETTRTDQAYALGLDMANMIRWEN